MNINAQELIEKINAKDPEFSQLWEQDIGKKNPLEKTLRFLVLSEYLKEPDGEFKNVISALKNNGFKLRRKEYPIYGLEANMYKETPDDELETIFNYDIVNKIHSLNYLKETDESYQNIQNIIKKYTKAFLDNRELFGRDLEASLLHINYASDNLEDAKKIIKTGDRIPYSSRFIRNLMADIIRGDDIDSLKELVETNPNYFKDLNKVIGRSFTHTMPNASNFSSSTDSKMKIININLLAKAAYEGEDVFCYLVNNFDFNMDGTVVSSRSDWEQDSLKQDNNWEKSLFNPYQSEKVPYTSDNDFIRKIPTSLASIIFTSYLDLTEEEKKQDTQLDAFLNGCIKQGSFNEVMNANINYWSSSQKLDQLGIYKYDKHNNFSTGGCNAYDVYMEFNVIRSYIYKNSEKIMLSLNTQQRNEFFSHLLLNSTTNYTYNKTASYSKDIDKYPYNISREVPESKFDYIIEKLSPLIPKKLKQVKNSRYYTSKIQELSDKINYNSPEIEKAPKNVNYGITNVKFLLQNISHMDNKELKQFTFFNKEYENNWAISHPGIKFDLSLISNKTIFHNLLKTDFTNNGKENPLTHLILTDGIHCLENSRRYYPQSPLKEDSPEEIARKQKENADAIILEEKRIQDSISSIQYLMDLSLKNNALSLPIPYEHKYNETFYNPLAVLLLEKNGFNIIIPALEDRHIKAFLKNDLFDNEEKNKLEITKALYSNISSFKLSENFQTQLVEKKEKVTHINKLIKLLVNAEFQFRPNPENKEESFAYIKMLGMIDDENVIKQIIGDEQSLFRTIFNKYALDNFGEEKILNSLQMAPLMNVFSEGNNNFAKAEMLFRETNAEETYKMFLTIAKPQIVKGANDSLLLDAVTNHQYNIVSAIVDYDSSSLKEPTKTNRYCLEYLIKAQVKAKKDRSSDLDILNKTIEKIINLGSSELLDNKKALENLSTAINNSKNNFSDIQTMKLNEYLLEHKIMKKALENEEKNKLEKPIETSFKL